MGEPLHSRGDLHAWRVVEHIEHLEMLAGQWLFMTERECWQDIYDWIDWCAPFMAALLDRPYL
eukprot:3853179-Pyramimonas_sp.AAC.1